MIYENDQILHVLLYDLWEKMLLHAAAAAQGNFCHDFCKEKKKKKKKHEKDVQKKYVALLERRK